MYFYFYIYITKLKNKMNGLLGLERALPPFSLFILLNSYLEFFKSFVNCSVTLPAKMTSIQVHFIGSGCEQQDIF